MVNLTTKIVNIGINDLILLNRKRITSLIIIKTLKSLSAKEILQLKQKNSHTIHEINDKLVNEHRELRR